MKKTFTILFMAGSGLLLSGCIASDRDMGTLKLQLKELNDTLSVMQTNQAELATKMEELNQNLSVSNENLSQLDSQIYKLSTKLDDISAMVQPAPATQPVPANTAEQETPVPSRVAVLPTDLFNEAKNHLDKAAYEQAAMGFKLYISKYPTGESAEQAHLYMGDSYYAAGQHRPAAVAYATVLQKFPQSKYIPSARVKYARSIVSLGKTEEAKRYFTSVMQDFASSPEAKQAKEELAKLK